MKITNPVFEQNYHEYLNQLDLPEVSIRSSELGVAMMNDGQTVRIPFFDSVYQVSESGITDSQGNQPDYSTCVILLKYLLMNPPYVTQNKEWIPFREFRDAGKGQNTGLSDYALKKISYFFSERLNLLKEAVEYLGAKKPEQQYPYDICVVIPALPQIPLLFLFNDKDEHLTAQAFILYERRAEYFLDAECRVMVDWCLFEHLKRAELRKS